MRMLRSIVPTTLALLLGVLACSSEDPGPTWTPTDLPEGTAVEPWGIGDRWYQYTFTGHTVTPADLSWVVIQGDGSAYFLTIEGYYGPDGRTGYPRMYIHAWDGGAFGEHQEWVAADRIQNGRLCLNFDSAETVDCDGDYDGIWRIDNRPVPEMGFSVPNPGFYSKRESGLRVYQYEGVTVPLVLPTENSEGEEGVKAPILVPSIFDEDAEPLLSIEKLTEDNRSVFMLLAMLELAEWQAVFNEDKSVLQIQSRCVLATPNHEDSADLDQEPEVLEFIVDEMEPWTFIDLCGTSREKGDDDSPALRVFKEQQVLRVGQWPINTSFGIALQRAEGNTPVRLWVSPDQPIEVRKSGAFEPTAPPESLWSIPAFGGL